MKRGLLTYLYITLTFGTLFLLASNGYRLWMTRREKNGGLERVFLERLAVGEFTQFACIVMILIAQLNPGVRIFSTWFAWFYWAGMALWFLGAAQKHTFFATMTPDPAWYAKLWQRIRGKPVLG